MVRRMIVRWGLESLEEVLAELSVSEPLLITEELWQDTELPVARRFHGARPHAEITGVRAGAEWTPFFGVRNEQTRTKDAGFDARVEGIVYEPKLTLRMPAQVTAGTALNALTNCAEALYVPDRHDASAEHALQGATLIARHLPAVLDDLEDLDA